MGEVYQARDTKLGRDEAEFVRGCLGLLLILLIGFTLAALIVGFLLPDTPSDPDSERVGPRFQSRRVTERWAA